MGKYASRDGNDIVAWGDITGKPTTFAPALHSNTSHTVAYAPTANPTFTGLVSAENIRLSWGGTQRSVEMYYDADYQIGMKMLPATRELVLYSYRSDETDTTLTLSGGNTIASGNIVAAKLQTANWSFEEDGNDLIIKRGSTILARLSNTGVLKTKAEQWVDSTI